MSNIIVTFILLACASQYDLRILQVEKLRVLYNEIKIKGLQLICPLAGLTDKPNETIDKRSIYWGDEAYIGNIPDNQISVNNLSLCCPNFYDKTLFVLFEPITELSCGFYSNNGFARIKRWSITYIDSPEVILKTKIDENFFKLTPYNASFSRLEYKISNKTLNNLSVSRMIFRLDCEPNLDRPLIIMTVIRLQYVKYGSTNETFEMVTNNEYPNDMQVFEGNGSKIEFIAFLKKLYNNPDNESYISLQCVNFLDEFQIGPKSNEFNFVKIDSDGNSNGGGNGNSGNSANAGNDLNINSSKNEVGLSTLELIIVCVFSVLGLALLLGLLTIVFRIFCRMK